MEYIEFGNTGNKVSRTGFGCIPIQRLTFDESTALLRRAYDGGVTLYDTANGYTTSEERIGLALGDVRKNVFLCTKSGSKTPEGLNADLEKSLRMMKTDYIDVFQFHNPGFVPKPGGEDGMYDFVLKAKAEGRIKHVGISAHSRERALEAAESGLYESLQYPFSYLSSDEELSLIDVCREKGVGILAMKALSGGLITNAKAAFAFLRQYESIVPIWGIQRISEIDEFLLYEKTPPEMDGETKNIIDADRALLSGSFCRSCGYCMPCAADIPIPMAARITFLMRRMIYENFITPEWQANMRKIDDCLGCGKCSERCPYGLNVPELLKRQRKEYFETIQNKS